MSFVAVQLLHLSSFLNLVWCVYACFVVGNEGQKGLSELSHILGLRLLVWPPIFASQFCSRFLLG